MIIIKERLELTIAPINHKYFKSHKNNIGKNFMINTSECYLHGDLEDKVGTDHFKILLTEDLLKSQYCKSLPKFDKLERITKEKFIAKSIDRDFSIEEKHFLFNGFVRCHVLGIDEPCIGSFWLSSKKPIEIYSNLTNNCFRSNYARLLGLVSLESDIDSLKYSEKCFLSLETII